MAAIERAAFVALIIGLVIGAYIWARWTLAKRRIWRDERDAHEGNSI